MDKDGFLRDFLKDYIEGEHMDMDGYEIQNLLDKHGFTDKRPITEAECEEPWAQEYGYEPGDPFHAYTDEMKKLVFG